MSKMHVHMLESDPVVHPPNRKNYREGSMDSRMKNVTGKARYTWGSEISDKDIRQYAEVQPSHQKLVRTLGSLDKLAQEGIEQAERKWTSKIGLMGESKQAQSELVTSLLKKKGDYLDTEFKHKKSIHPINVAFPVAELERLNAQAEHPRASRSRPSSRPSTRPSSRQSSMESTRLAASFGERRFSRRQSSRRSSTSLAQATCTTLQSCLNEGISNRLTTDTRPERQQRPKVELDLAEDYMENRDVLRARPPPKHIDVIQSEQQSEQFGRGRFSSRRRQSEDVPPTPTTPSTPTPSHLLTDVKHSLYNPSLPSIRAKDRHDVMHKLQDEHCQHSTHLSMQEFAEPEASVYRRHHPSRDPPGECFVPENDFHGHEKVQQEDVVKAKDAWAKFLDSGSCGDKSTEKKLFDDFTKKENVHFDGYLLKDFPIAEPEAKPYTLTDGPRVRHYREQPVANDILSQFRPNKKTF